MSETTRARATDERLTTHDDGHRAQTPRKNSDSRPTTFQPTFYFYEWGSMGASPRAPLTPLQTP
eukprot:scaffold43227_cov29-Tisochrysis_lutea.AAC.3